MNKSILLSMGLPILIINKQGLIATIELNHSEFVVCRFHPNNSVYLQDARLEGWLPTCIFNKWIYKWKVWVKYR